MAAPFSIEHIARVRDGSRRLATKAAHHELAIRKFLTDAESAFEHARIAWTHHDGSPADRLSKVLQSQMLRSAADVAAVRLIKAIDELRETRLIAYTARIPQPEISECFTAVIRKPSPPEVVVEAVKRLAAA